jgi:hypothetical protein
MMTALNSVFPVIKSVTAATNLIEAYRLAHFFLILKFVLHGALQKTFITCRTKWMSQLATWEVGRILACLDYRMGNRSDGTGSITGSTARHSYTAQSNRELKVIDTTVSKPQNPQHDPALHRPPPPLHCLDLSARFASPRIARS